MTPEFRASAVVGRQAPHWNDASRKALAEDIRQQIIEATNEPDDAFERAVVLGAMAREVKP